MLLPTKLHGVADYATAGTLLAAPALLRGADSRSKLVLSAAGGGILATSLLTDYELGVRRRIPMPVHLALDAATGAALLLAPRLLGVKRRSRLDWLPHVLVGVGELAGAALTQRTPGDRSEESERAGVGTVSTQPPTAPATADVPVNTDRGPDGLAPRIAPAPLETPGPSVTAPALPESETERAEWAEAHIPEMDFLAPTSTTDAIVAEEEAAAAAEAALIGGVVPHDSDGPAMDHVYQAGGGEAEGFEAAEEDLIENATHGDGEGNPIRDAIDVEAEADLSSAVYGEADRLPSTEVTFDPDAGPDDAGEGPGLAAERSEGVQPQPDEYQDRQ